MKPIPTANTCYDELPGVAPADPFAEDWSPEGAIPLDDAYRNYTQALRAVPGLDEKHLLGIACRRCPGCPFGPRPPVAKAQVDRERRRWEQNSNEAFPCHRFLARSKLVICRGYLLEQRNAAAEAIAEKLRNNNLAELPVPAFDPSVDWTERAMAAGKPGIIQS